MNRLLLALLCAAPELAAGDAAIKGREGDVNHWIEHYQRERQPQQSARPAGDQPASMEPKRAAPGAHEKESKR